MQIYNPLLLNKIKENIILFRGKEPSGFFLFFQKFFFFRTFLYVSQKKFVRMARKTFFYFIFQQIFFRKYFVFFISYASRINFKQNSKIFSFLFSCSFGTPYFLFLKFQSYLIYHNEKSNKTKGQSLVISEKNKFCGLLRISIVQSENISLILLFQLFQLLEKITKKKRGIQGLNFCAFCPFRRFKRISLCKTISTLGIKILSLNVILKKKNLFCFSIKKSFRKFLLKLWVSLGYLKEAWKIFFFRFFWENLKIIKIFFLDNFLYSLVLKNKVLFFIPFKKFCSELKKLEIFKFDLILRISSFNSQFFDLSFCLFSSKKITSRVSRSFFQDLKEIFLRKKISLARKTEIFSRFFELKFKKKRLLKFLIAIILIPRRLETRFFTQTSILTPAPFYNRKRGKDEMFIMNQKELKNHLIKAPQKIEKENYSVFKNKISALKKISLSSEEGQELEIETSTKKINIFKVWTFFLKKLLLQMARKKIIKKSNEIFVLFLYILFISPLRVRFSIFFDLSFLRKGEIKTKKKNTKNSFFYSSLKRIIQIDQFKSVFKRKRKSLLFYEFHLEEKFLPDKIENKKIFKPISFFFFLFFFKGVKRNEIVLKEFFFHKMKIYFRKKKKILKFLNLKFPFFFSRQSYFNCFSIINITKNKKYLKKKTCDWIHFRNLKVQKIFSIEIFQTLNFFSPPKKRFSRKNLWHLLILEQLIWRSKSQIATNLVFKKIFGKK